MLLVVVTILSYFRELMLGENKYMKFCELD